VNAFPGHIACDANSKSEIVVPLRKNNQIIGVLGIMIFAFQYEQQFVLGHFCLHQ
jgi:putative methionine-R-sulfoxide reductase with GAF domain